jgi:hypothetical protein
MNQLHQVYVPTHDGYAVRNHNNIIWINYTVIVDKNPFRNQASIKIDG